MSRTYAVIYVEIGTGADDPDTIDENLILLKEDVEDFLGPEWKWHLEDVIVKKG